MIPFVKRVITKVMTFVVEYTKKLLILATLFSFVVLFVLFFVYLHRGSPFMCITCLAGIVTFIHLNKVL